MRFTLISPRIAIQKGDFLGSGVPYWPVELAVFAGFLRERGEGVAVLDLLGSAPRRLEDKGDHYLQGQPLDELIASAAVKSADAFVVYAMSSMSHAEVVQIVSAVKRARPDAAVAVLENSQAVTAYALPRLADQLFAAGADALICGEPYFDWEATRAYLLTPQGAERPPNVVGPRDPAVVPKRRTRERGAKYPLPAWDLFALEGYWSLPYSHGPKTPRFLPILTSRGCPFGCDFCVIPETNARGFRARAPEEVVAEMIALRDRFGVRDFQVEDVNPTVNPHYWQAIAEQLIEREAGVRFYFVSGTKAETVHLDQLALLARAGCRYISISPESGSPAVLRAIGKPFNHDYGLELIAACKEHGIVTQACFLTGHPAESPVDHQRSRDYLKQLVRAGLDEVAVFVVAPLPGSAIYDHRRLPMHEADRLVSFSPKGRGDWRLAAARRRELISLFLREKLLRGLVIQGLRSLGGTPRTKMENLPRRVLYVYSLVAEHRVKRWLQQKRPAGS